MEHRQKKVKAQVVSGRELKTMHGFIAENLESGKLIYADDFKCYRQLANKSHQFVKHSAVEYVNEFTSRDNIRELNTINQVNYIVEKLKMKKPEYIELVFGIDVSS